MNTAAQDVPALEALILAGELVPAETLARARPVQEETDERLDGVLTRLGLLSERALAEAIARASGLEIADVDDYPAEPVELGGMSPRFLRDARAVPLRRNADGLEVAFVDPLDPYPAHALAFALRTAVTSRIGLGGDVEVALDRLYGATHAADAGGDGAEADEADLERLRDMASDAPVVRAVNRLIATAVELRASDIHLEPAEESLRVRMRVDGAMHEEPALPGHLKGAFVSRIKVMSGLNIAERRLPQDGRPKLAVRGHDIDLRVATSPTIHGESVAMRLLDRSNLALEFESLGFDATLLPTWIRALRQPHGIVLVTGPTGSGKTTTLYASLMALNTSERKLLTIEDPIEYRLDGVNQTQVNPQIGLNFAEALRSFLRQDPDVMMVGEIRDLETAQVAVQAALTGHTILSTLHTNTAAAAFTRLMDMGVEPFLITSSVNAVLAQRLVRRLCPHCREPYQPTAEQLAAIGWPADTPRPATLFHNRGCGACGNSGYRGRAAILELLVMDEPISRLALQRAEARDINRAAVDAGMRTMLQDGLTKAAAGLTTAEEVLRVTKDG